MVTKERIEKFNVVTDVYVIKNSQGQIVRLASKKFCWDSIGSVNSALAHHIRSLTIYHSRTELVTDDTIKSLSSGWIFSLYNPHEYMVMIADEVKLFKDVKSVRKALLDSKTIEIVKIN